MPDPGAKYADRLRALLRRRAPAIAVFVVLMILFDATRAWSANDTQDDFVGGITTSVRVNWVLILASALAPYVVEAAYVRPIMRAVFSVLVTFLLVALPALVIGHLLEGPVTPGVRDGRLLSNATFLVRGWWLYSVAGLLFAAYCQTRDRQIAAIRAVRTAELERADAQRDIMASRLQVLQARVEPELLFEALGDVKRAYLHDPEAAEGLLDDLIAYLRAALPQMRGGMSTVLREAALAEAYLKVVPAGRNGGLVVCVRIADDAGAMPFPPMVLVPLAHAASEGAPATIRIVAPCIDSADGSRRNAMEICLDATEIPAGWEEAGLLGIRGALQNFFDASATVHIEAGGSGVRAVVSWPAADAPNPSSSLVVTANAA